MELHFFSSSLIERYIYIYPEIDIKLSDFVLLNVISVKDSKSTSLLALSTNLNRNNTGAKIYSKANKNFCLHSSFFDKVSATDYVKRCFHFLRILGLVLLYNHLRTSMLIKKNIYIMHCVRFPFHYSFQTCFIKLFNFFLTFFNFPIERYKIYIGKFPIDFFF